MSLFAFASFFSPQYKKAVLIVSTACLGSLMAFKALTIGNDTPSYVYFFNHFSDVSTFFDYELRFEYGFQFFSKLIYLIFHDVQFLFVFTAIICMFSLSKTIYRFSENVAFSFFLFISLRFFYFYLSGIRQAIALSLTFFAFKYLVKANLRFFLFFVFLASSFHSSALVFIFAWPLSRMPLNKQGILALIGCFFVFYLLFANIIPFVFQFLPVYYGHYVGSEAFKSNNLGNFVSLLIKLLVVAFIVLSGYIEQIKKDFLSTEQYKMKTILVYFTIFSVCLSLISTRASLLDRFEYYYWIFVILLIPSVIEYMEKNKKLFFYYVFFIATTAYNMFLFVYRPEWHKIVPYHFFWN
ncbi:EpsG family protein [Fibrobacter sp. UWB15]|uniref:EpsG family protein n=1 Tax=unclassified Fibrobacter TaxID=2634177 RepID=UPI00091EE1FA|nr:MULTISPECIES: EpsG family protein [unclassified Fibrobacter]PWJ65607.1 EpsG-like putative glucosyltransferase [Fibrobacter sp. UWB6]SHF97963.1 EpsG family protein [Fibrobacter sp. UWB8]SMG23809.1 EpsG family protein [Fibrobacter sp. UWB15]